MEKRNIFGWVYYFNKEEKHDPQKVGKWMFFFNKNRKFYLIINTIYDRFITINF